MGHRGNRVKYGVAAALAAMAKTLSCEVRAELLLALAEGPRGVGELAAVLELEPASVSRHLGELKSHGFVSSVSAGRRVIYALGASARIQEHGDGVVVMVSDRAGSTLLLEVKPGRRDPADRAV